MKISRHAQKRLQQRGLDLTVLKIIEETILPKYSNNSQQFFLKRRDVLEIGSIIRRIADKFEKSAGTKMIFDSSGSTLITESLARRV